MPFKINIAEGRTLCGRCHNGQVMKRDGGEIVVHCTELYNNPRMPPDISSCTSFEDRAHPQKWEMEKIAWAISHDKGGRFIGFKPPKKHDAS